MFRACHPNLSHTQCVYIGRLIGLFLFLATLCGTRDDKQIIQNNNKIDMDFQPSTDQLHHRWRISDPPLIPVFVQQNIDTTFDGADFLLWWSRGTHLCNMWCWQLSRYVEVGLEVEQCPDWAVISSLPIFVILLSFNRWVVLLRRVWLGCLSF